MKGTKLCWSAYLALLVAEYSSVHVYVLVVVHRVLEYRKKKEKKNGKKKWKKKMEKKMEEGKKKGKKKWSFFSVRLCTHLGMPGNELPGASTFRWRKRTLFFGASVYTPGDDLQ